MVNSTWLSGNKGSPTKENFLIENLSGNGGKGKKKGLSTGAIVGIVIGALFLLYSLWHHFFSTKDSALGGGVLRRYRDRRALAGAARAYASQQGPE